MGFAEDRKEWLDLLRPFTEERGFSRHTMHVAASILAEHGDDVRSMTERQLLRLPHVGPEVAKFIFSYFHEVRD